MKVKLNQNLLLFVSVLFIIYWDSLYFASNKIEVTVQYAALGIMTVYVVRKNWVWKFKDIVYVILPILVLFMGIIANSKFSMGYIVKACLLICGCFYVKEFPMKKFSYVYIKIMHILSLLSCIVYFLAYFLWNIVKNGMEIFPIIDRQKTIFFYNLGFYNVATDLYSRGRNYGIFQEPGAYAIFICVAILLMIRFFENERWFKRKLIVFSLTILTTLSTSGIICYGMVMFYYILKQSRFRFFNKSKLFLSISMTIIVLAFLCTSNYAVRIFAKLGTDLGEGIDHSLSARFYSIIRNISIFIKSPVWGVGPARYTYLFWDNLDHLSEIGIWVSQTNTLLGVGAVFGGIIGGQFSYLQYMFAKKINFNYRWYIFLIIVCLLFSQDYEYSILLHILGYYGISKEGSGLNERKKTFNNMCSSI